MQVLAMLRCSVGCGLAVPFIKLSHNTPPLYVSERHASVRHAASWRAPASWGVYRVYRTL